MIAEWWCLLPNWVARCRAARASRKRSVVAHRPRWFRKARPAKGDRVSRAESSDVWQYAGDYWEMREVGEGFGICPELFGAEDGDE